MLSRIRRMLGLGDGGGPEIARRGPPGRRDVLPCLLLAGGMIVLSLALSGTMPRVVLIRATMDTWFDSDVTRVYQNMSRRGSWCSRTSVHPVFPLISHLPVHGLMSLGMEPWPAVRVVMAGVGGVWMVLLYLALRWLGCRRADAAVFSLLAASSAASLFWSAVPDTFPWGGAALLAAVILGAWSVRARPGWVWYWLAQLGGLAFTITNWMASLLATCVRFRWRRAAAISVAALAALLALWTAQKWLYPTSRLPFMARQELVHCLRDYSGGPAACARSFLFHTMAMPELTLVPQIEYPQWPRMTAQFSGIGSGTTWGRAAAVLWGLLLAAGMLALLADPADGALRLTLGGTLLGQFGMHVIYGYETFLYAMHFVGLLVLAAAWGARTRLRKVVVSVAAICAILLAVNNTLQFRKAVAYYEEQPRRVAQQAAASQADGAPSSATLPGTRQTR